MLTGRVILAVGLVFFFLPPLVFDVCMNEVVGYNFYFREVSVCSGD